MKKLVIIIITVSLVAVGCKKKEGCTDSTATNYDAAAEKDNGSCIAATTTTTGGTTTGTVAKIGDFRDGGVVFWVDSTDNTKGLVVDLNDLERAPWGCNAATFNGAIGTAIGTGSQNTKDKIAGCSEDSTATVFCANSTSGGHSDWFLPSKDELNEIYKNKAVIETAVLGNGGSVFLDQYYWSSSGSVSGSNIAWEQTFNGGGQYFGDSKFSNNVRAVRAFQ